MAKRRNPVVLTADELEALLTQVQPTSPTGLRNKAILKVMAYGGLRVSEVVALTAKDVRRDGGRTVLEIRDGKGGVDRTVPLADHVAESLQAWQAARRELGVGNGHLFCTIRKGKSVHPVATADGLAADQVTTSELTPGEPLTARYLQNLVPRLAEKAGIEKRVTPHVLRHTAATMTLRAVGDVRRVQELLGHADVRTTQIYTHVLAEDVAEAIDQVPDVEAREALASVEVTNDVQAPAARIAAMGPEERAVIAKLLGGDG